MASAFFPEGGYDGGMMSAQPEFDPYKTLYGFDARPIKPAVFGNYAMDANTNLFSKVGDKWVPVTQGTSFYDPAATSDNNERQQLRLFLQNAPAGTDINDYQKWAVDHGFVEPSRAPLGGPNWGMMAAVLGAGMLPIGGLGGLGEAGLAAADAAGGLLPAFGSEAAYAAGLSGAGAAGTGMGGAMDWTDVLGDWPTTTEQGGMLNWQNAIPDFTNYTGQMTQVPGLEQTLAQIPNDLSLNTVQSALAGNPGLFESIRNFVTNNPGSTVKSAIQALSGNSAALQAVTAGLNGIGGLLSGNAAQNAAQTTANAQIEAARIAAEAAKFKPIGVTTRFGQSQFQKDANGNVIGAGYTLSPEMKAQQDALIGVSNQALTQYQNAPNMFAPMGDAGQRAMTLGNQYLAADPQAQALKYMQDQQALLATGRERDMNQMLTGEFNRGTYGLATGGTSTGMGAANPRLEAMLNAQRQQDLGLATQATQGGMDYAKFGAGLVGTGGDLTKGMFSGQTAAYQPYQTALQGAQYIEGLGQQPLTMGMDLGRQTSNAASGGLLAQGMVNAAQTQQNAAYSPWGTLLMGAGNTLQNYNNQQQQQQQQQAFIDAMKTWRT